MDCASTSVDPLVLVLHLQWVYLIVAHVQYKVSAIYSSFKPAEIDCENPERCLINFVDESLTVSPCILDVYIYSCWRDPSLISADSASAGSFLPQLDAGSMHIPSRINIFWTICR
jgi:hypothetical protein